MATVTFPRFLSRLPKRRMCSAHHHTLTTRSIETGKFSQCQERLQTLHSPVPNIGHRQNHACRNCHTVSLSPLTPRSHSHSQSHSQSQRYFSSSARHFFQIQRSQKFQSSRTSRNRSSVTAAGAGGADADAEVPGVENSSSQLQQRFVYVHTSVNRWEDVPGGLLFDTAYLDSRPGAKINAAEPLVVSLHSTPGSFHDMQPVLEAFAKTGCRVLAPAFPGGGKTEGLLHGYNDVFTHSTSEKAEFVRDFLVTLDVNKVDLLLGHGCGCYPALRLTAGKDTAPMFKSAAFLSPWPHRDFKGTSQTNLLLLLHDMWERPYYRPLARVLSRLVNHTGGVGSLERMTLVNTLYNLDFGEIGGLGVALDTQRCPWVMMFAEDDGYVEPQLLHELAHMMGLGEDRVTRFTGQLTRGTMEQFPSCVVFDKGGQHLHRHQSGVITAILFNLLKSVRPGFAAL